MTARRHYVTLRDVGRAAGVHTSTASLGLRNDPRLRPATCARIQQAARSLGYVPDPLVASLASFRRTIRPLRYRATLAWITNDATREGWRDHDQAPEFYAAAEAATRSAGYKLDEFWLRTPGMTDARASRILSSRGIRGLLIAPRPDARAPVLLDWTKFSCVAVGQPVGHTGLHLACSNRLRSIQRALHHVAIADYRRIGFIGINTPQEPLDDNWLGAYIAWQLPLPAARRLPPLILPQWDADTAARWIKQHRPDAIVTSRLEIQGVLRRLNLKAPRDLGLAFLNLPHRSGALAGIYEEPAEVGAGAAGWLIDLVRRNERGIPAIPQRLMFDSVWVDGKTLRPTRSHHAATSRRAQSTSTRKPAA